MKRVGAVGAICVAAALPLSACGSHATTSTPGAQSNGTATATTPAENNPIGDIPDTQVYVPFVAPDGSFSLSVPEGWARTVDGTAVTFTDKLNSVRIDQRPAVTAPTPDSVRRDELSSVKTTDGKVAVQVVTRNAGDAVLATYRAAAPPNPVTGKAEIDDVERYSFWRPGQEAILTLSGPVGADNVDPWRTITDSFRWR
ncbi:hypothetical protein DVS77_10830 [Mycolicibacterium moriokaense]|nr:hypothetical protein DVS77_10830 [Mycolicibacterium moriokaense]